MTSRRLVLGCTFAATLILLACGGGHDDNGLASQQSSTDPKQDAAAQPVDDIPTHTLYSSPQARVTATLGEAVAVRITDKKRAGHAGSSTSDLALDGRDWKLRVVADWRNQTIESIERGDAELQIRLDELEDQATTVQGTADTDDLLMFLRAYPLRSPEVKSFVSDAVIIRVSSKGVSDPIHLTGVWLNIQDSNGDGKSELIVGDGSWLCWRGVVPGHVVALNPRPRVAYWPLGRQLVIDKRAPNMLERTYFRERAEGDPPVSAEEVLRRIADEIFAMSIENGRRDALHEAMVQMIYAGHWNRAVQLASQVYAESTWDEGQLQELLEAMLAQFALSCIFEDLLVAYPDLRQAYD